MTRRNQQSFSWLFNAILWVQYFPPTWKHASVISVLKPGKEPAQLLSYRPRSLFGTIVNLFEKNLLTRILNEVSSRGILRNDQFGFRPKHSTALQLTSLAERFPGTLVRRDVGAVFLAVAKAFSTL